MTQHSLPDRCRNCGLRGKLSDLGFIGQVSPFFLKRVAGIRIGTVRSSTRWKALVRKAAQFPQSLFDRISPPTALVELQLCENCSFIQTKVAFHEVDVNRLYVDYREESYNRERIELEPRYAAIVADVGQSSIEINVRLAAATTFLKRNIKLNRDAKILDYGGSDGKFIPHLEGERYVFEISPVEPIAGVTRVHIESELGTYTLVQLAHVVEHVVEPLELVTRVASRVDQGGFLYVETPQEISDDARTRLKNGRGMVGIHEHINSCCVASVKHLIINSGFDLLDIEATSIDVGWGTSVHIRALGQKR